MKREILSALIIFAIAISTSNVVRAEYDYSQINVLVDTYHSGPFEWEGWPSQRGGPYYSTIDYLQDLGYTVDVTTGPLTDYILSEYDLILERGYLVDFTQDELDSVESFMNTGGGIIMGTDTALRYGNTIINQIANVFGIEFVGDFYADAELPSPNMTGTGGNTAWLVNKNTPIGAVVLSGLTEPPETGWGWFVAWDGAPLFYPTTATDLVRFDGRQTYGPYYYDVAGLVALEYGQGRVIAGPNNGLFQPWAPDTSDTQNKILLNSVAWTTDTSICTKMIHNPVLYTELTVTSLPKTGVLFTIDGTPQITPYSEWLLKGSYTLEMPEEYNGHTWSHWLEDEDTNKIKAIYLRKDTLRVTWTGVYEERASAPVGGVWVPINKFELLAPWIGLSSFLVVPIVAVSALYVKHRRKQQN